MLFISVALGCLTIQFFIALHFYSSYGEHVFSHFAITTSNHQKDRQPKASLTWRHHAPSSVLLLWTPSFAASYQSPRQTCSFLLAFLSHTHTHTQTDTHTRTLTHAHIYSHKVPYAHLYSKAYTLGLRKSPFTNVLARGPIFHQSMETLTPTDTQWDCGVSGEPPNCVALLEEWSLSIPFFTSKVLDGQIQPQGLPLCAWSGECVYVCVLVRVCVHLPALILYAICIGAQYRCVTALSYIWKQCTMGDVSLWVHLSPALSATQLSILTGSRAEEQWGFRALSCRSQKSPRTTFKADTWFQDTAALRCCAGNSLSLFFCFYTRAFTWAGSAGLKRPINPESVITTLKPWNDANDTPREVCDRPLLVLCWTQWEANAQWACCCGTLD